MKIVDIRAVRVVPPDRPAPAGATARSWHYTAEVANPMSGYARYKSHRSLWLPAWEQTWCQVTLEDGTRGLGSTSHGRVTAAIIDDHLAPILVGEDGYAVERLADMMFRLTKPYGSGGLAAYAVSAVDLALWDAKGRSLGQPVYSLIGGSVRDSIPCYATGNDVDWYQTCGYTRFKLACPYGPADGLAGLDKNEAFVADARARVGDQSDLMLDCWMAFDVEYTVELANRLRPYRLKWMEEYLIPEDFDGHLEVRRRLPWQTLATGEHWYGVQPFQWAARHQAIDIFQPDIAWCGGLSTCLKIAAVAESAGKRLILHGGGNTVWGQHFSISRACVPLLECFQSTDPGVEPTDGVTSPGLAVPVHGSLVPNTGPGFGLEIEDAWIENFFTSSQPDVPQPTN